MAIPTESYRVDTGGVDETIMKIRNRIKEFRTVPASELLPNPKNWRKHPETQENALRSMLADVGFADAVIARETPAGLVLIDGHLRTEVASDTEVPVLIVDLNDEEADKVLATHDVLGAMAATDSDILADLLAGITVADSDLSDILSEMANLGSDLDFSEAVSGDETDALESKFEVVILCDDEEHQRNLLDRFSMEGLTCQSLIS